MRRFLTLGELRLGELHMKNKWTLIIKLLQKKQLHTKLIVKRDKEKKKEKEEDRNKPIGKRAWLRNHTPQFK